jgi:hypothetical protein
MRHDHPALCVYDGLPEFLGGLAVECPVCTKQSNPDWHAFETMQDGAYTNALLGVPSNGYNHVSLEWMRCANESCNQLIVQIHERQVTGSIAGGAPLFRIDSWTVRPRFGDLKRPIDPLVPEPFRTDYQESTALLEVSPRMSAVLARRIAGDLLKTYAGKKHFSLTARIRSFIKDGEGPASLRDNLDHFREIADFGAHTQEAVTETESGEMEVVIIDADRDDAEWTLDIVDRLFDHFIVQRGRDEAMRRKWDENIARTGRDAIRPSDEEDGDS